MLLGKTAEAYGIGELLRQVRASLILLDKQLSIDNFVVPTNADGLSSYPSWRDIEGVDMLSPKLSVNIVEPSFLRGSFQEGNGDDQEEMGGYLEVEIPYKCWPCSMQWKQRTWWPWPRRSRQRCSATLPRKESEVGACKDIEGHIIFTIGSGNKGKDHDMLHTSMEKLATYIGTKYGDEASQESWTSGKKITLSEPTYSKAIRDRHTARVKSTRE